MPPLITHEEALTLGEIEDHAAIEALIDRAWRVRTDLFADSTDLCSLVNAKCGGCAEDCGFCAQSRFAEAETPLHAMMSPEQILEHARAAEAAGAHRSCMVTQGQGLSKRDFEIVLEATRLVAEHTNLKRCTSIGHVGTGRAKALKQAGSQRVHHNGANPRHDGRSGRLAGETPDVIARHVRAPLSATPWDPSTQRRFAKESSVPRRPDGAPNRRLLARSSTP